MEENIVEQTNFDAEYALQTENLTKTYFRKNAVDNVNLNVQKGDIYGFIGKNGAGKTTTIRMIAGLAKPTKGKISLFGGEKLSAARKKISTVIETPALYPYMTAKQNINVQRILKGVKDKSVTNELLKVVGLDYVGRKKVKNFSLGMKQRLAIAIALVGDPEFLFLDEPINGLDPTGIKEVRELLIKLSSELGITILISSHILSELVKVANRYGVINNGKLVAEFSRDELQNLVRPCAKFTVNDPGKAVALLTEMMHISDFEVDDKTITIFEKLDQMSVYSSILSENDIIVESLLQEAGDYEGYFIKLMEGESVNV